MFDKTSTPTQSNATELLTAARKYRKLGRWPLPIPLREKGPRIPKWTDLRLSDQEIEQKFGGPQINIGILVGEPSDWTVDVDLDCDEAIEFAPEILPTTAEKFGRPSKPLSHYIYRSPEMKTHQFQDTNGSMIVEIRSTGGQTVFPPSVHPSGEAITWASEGSPTEVAAADLLRAVSLLAVMALLARHWPGNGRNKLTLAVSATFARAGLADDEIQRLIELICNSAGDEKARERVRTSKYAEARVESGKPAYGIATISEILGEAIAEKVRAWLNLKSERKKEPGREAERDRLVKTVADVELWHSGDDAYVSVDLESHIEHMRVRGRSFRRLIAARAFARGGRPPTRKSVDEAIEALEAKALRGDEHPVHLRVARQGDAIYVALCDKVWRAVEVTRDGWQVRERPPVRFVRTAGMEALPCPVKGGKIEDLRQFVNVNSDDFVLFMAALMGCFVPDIPYPILMLVGEQGSSKSTLAKLHRALVDPNKVPIRAMPRTEDDLYIAARNGWVLSFDNLSTIWGATADALCRLATGGGFSKRQLYTDAEEILCFERRPVVLNGIPLAAERPDLLDRSIVLVLPRIDEQARRTERQYWGDFNRLAPEILGAIFDALSAGIRLQSTVTLDEMPRMSDFAICVVAMEEALGFEPGTFMAAYSKNRTASLVDVASNDPLVQAIVSMLSDNPSGRMVITATTLLAVLNSDVTNRPRFGWPATPNHLTKMLRRLAPAMRAMGINVVLDHGRDEKNVKLIEISWSVDEPEIADLELLFNPKS